MESNLLETNLKEINLICPICKKQIKMLINLEILEKNKEGSVGLVAFSTKHCNKIIIAHVDKSCRVRSVEYAINTFESENNIDGGINEFLDKAYHSSDNNSLKEDLEFYFCNEKCSHEIKNIPNVIEKQMLRIIIKSKGSNLKDLKSGLKEVEEAYNMNFSYTQLEKLLDKYINMGYITKEIF